MDFGLSGVNQGGREYVSKRVSKADSRKNHVARGAASGGAAGAAYGALGAGVGAGVGAVKGRVKKRNVFDPERSRKNRLENYQVAGHAGGGMLAGAGAAAGASRVGGNLKRLGVSPNRKGISNLRVGDAARAINPGRRAAAATLGGIGAMAAGDAVQRYRRSGRGDTYRSLR